MKPPISSGRYGADDRAGAMRASTNMDANGDADQTCPNCGANLRGEYCHDCGQHAPIARTLTALWNELFRGILHLDGRLLRTLPLLALKPGELTHRYINGERTKFTGPMAVFLFSIFLLFLASRVAGVSSPDVLNVNVAGKPVIEQANGDVGDQEDDLGVAINIDVPEARGAQSTGPLDADEKAKQAEQSEVQQKWLKNPDLMYFKLRANAFKFSWLLVPLTMPFVWLLFARSRQFPPYDHAIFVTYSLAFMSLLFIALSLLGRIGIPGEILLIIGLLVPPIHLYKQFRGTYDVSIFGAIWRVIVLSVVIFSIVLSAFSWFIFKIGGS